MVDGSHKRRCFASCCCVWIFSPGTQGLLRLQERGVAEARMAGISDRKKVPAMPSHKTFRVKKKLAKKMRQNRPIPYWIRARTDNTTRYNAKRRRRRRTKLGF
ncbi:60S ribosomal protein L39-like [Prosopis cineraria]|uniref:60S ribosomal protein L39-like n=1 Tax=Prosopis cineraria TaxID=364024 RepID=UPI00240ED124|nr:60S ribosomal protein L39-like [Prosopis cineraria]